MLRLPPDAITVYSLAGLDELNDYLRMKGAAFGVYECPRCEGTGAPIDRASGRLLSGRCSCCLGHEVIVFDGLRGIQVGADVLRIAREGRALPA